MHSENITAQEKFELVKTESFVSEHYVFHYRKGSLAEKEIDRIAQKQEDSFSKICHILNVSYPDRIHYYFTDSPNAISRAVWGEDFPCNGVALCGRNKIYAVYTEKIRCIGAHEDTHLISFLINYPESDFVVEGLAVALHGLWWGLPNETWASYYMEKYPDLLIESLFDNDVFSKVDSVIAYPVAGAFTQFLMDTFSVERYLKLYKYSGSEYSEFALSLFGISLSEIAIMFRKKMKTVAFDAQKLEEMLKEEGVLGD